MSIHWFVRKLRSHFEEDFEDGNSRFVIKEAKNSRLAMSIKNL